MKAPRHRELGKIRRGASEISMQLRWIMECGGDLAGYRAKYAPYPDVSPDAIYHADMDYLRQLSTGHAVTDHDKAVEILGEEYFA